jgi:hypothetical protein
MAEDTFQQQALFFELNHLETELETYIERLNFKDVRRWLYCTNRMFNTISEDDEILLKKFSHILRW